MMMISIISLAFCVTFFQTQVSSKALYSFKTGHDLQNIQFHGDDVFLGATNIIYRMNGNLVQLRRKLTGPVNESTGCPPEKPCLRNNSNAVLLLYGENSNSKLLSCGFARQGICHLRDLKTLNVKFSSDRGLGAQKDNYDKLVSLITGGNKFLHLGIPSNGKRLQTNSNYAVMEIDRLTSRMFLRSTSFVKFDEGFAARQVSMFSTNGYVYITTVQQTKTLSRSYHRNYHSKIIRYWDTNIYNSFTEIQLLCQDKSQNEYNILVDGYFVNITGKGAFFFNASDGESVFVGIFSKSAGKDQTDRNVVCIFKLKEVNRAFERSIKLCVEEGVGIDLPWFIESPGCKVLYASDFYHLLFGF
eukprot:Seg3864.1 transcript_id=Seg3864.1/GoldUCD/mRNA.D3Y31 product=Plexin-A1 protein_id=Seg3864.1/GoldUCD/D3Y31